MKKNKALLIVIILAVITAAVAFIHLSTREEVAEGTVQVSQGDQVSAVELSELEYEQVTGTRVNGKGEEIPVDGSGVLLKTVLDEAGAEGYSSVTVTSDDSYSAELTREEVEDESKAWLILQEEGGLRLIVFGDSNSKRSVSNVVQIAAE